MEKFYVGALLTKNGKKFFRLRLRGMTTCIHMQRAAIIARYCSSRFVPAFYCRYFQ